MNTSQGPGWFSTITLCVTCPIAGSVQHLGVGSGVGRSGFRLRTGPQGPDRDGNSGLQTQAPLHPVVLTPPHWLPRSFPAVRTDVLSTDQEFLGVRCQQ